MMYQELWRTLQASVLQAITLRKAGKPISKSLTVKALGLAHEMRLWPILVPLYEIAEKRNISTRLPLWSVVSAYASLGEFEKALNISRKYLQKVQRPIDHPEVPLNLILILAKIFAVKGERRILERLGRASLERAVNKGSRFALRQEQLVDMSDVSWKVNQYRLMCEVQSPLPGSAENFFCVLDQLRSLGLPMTSPYAYYCWMLFKIFQHDPDAAVEALQNMLSSSIHHGIGNHFRSESQRLMYFLLYGIREEALGYRIPRWKPKMAMDLSFSPNAVPPAVLEGWNPLLDHAYMVLNMEKSFYGQPNQDLVSMLIMFHLEQGDLSQAEDLCQRQRYRSTVEKARVLIHLAKANAEARSFVHAAGQMRWVLQRIHLSDKFRAENIWFRNLDAKGLLKGVIPLPSDGPSISPQTVREAWGMEGTEEAGHADLVPVEGVGEQGWSWTACSPVLEASPQVLHSQSPSLESSIHTVGSPAWQRSVVSSERNLDRERAETPPMKSDGCYLPPPIPQSTAELPITSAVVSRRVPHSAKPLAPPNPGAEGQLVVASGPAPRAAREPRSVRVQRPWRGEAPSLPAQPQDSPAYPGRTEASRVHPNRKSPPVVASQHSAVSKPPSIKGHSQYLSHTTRFTPEEHISSQRGTRGRLLPSRSRVVPGKPVEPTLETRPKMPGDSPALATVQPLLGAPQLAGITPIPQIWGATSVRTRFPSSRPQRLEPPAESGIQGQEHSHRVSCDQRREKKVAREGGSGKGKPEARKTPPPPAKPTERFSVSSISRANVDALDALIEEIDREP